MWAPHKHTLLVISWLPITQATYIWFRPSLQVRTEGAVARARISSCSATTRGRRHVRHASPPNSCLNNRAGSNRGEQEPCLIDSFFDWKVVGDLPRRSMEAQWGIMERL